MADFTHPDFTPVPGTYKDLTPFRYWCQKVLPLVYDDSLSYYELLCKVIDYLNQTMTNVEILHGDVTSLHNAFILLQQFVDNYFTNLDVQQEINNKLDEMATNGELANIITPIILDFANPTIVDSTDKMTNKGKLYVLSTNGMLYQWNGTAWENTGLVFGGINQIDAAGYAMVLVREGLYVEWVEGNSIKFPTSTVFFKNKNYNTTSQTIDLSSISVPIIYFDLETNSYYAQKFTSPNSRNNPIIGYIWNGVVWINGVPQKQILFNSKFYNPGWGDAFFGINSGYVELDTATFELTLPKGNFISYTSKTYAVTSPITINLKETPTSANAWVLLWDNVSKTILPFKWQNPDIPSPLPVLGYVYGDNVFIHGVPQTLIKVNGIYKEQNTAFLGFNNQTVVYNKTDKSITFPGGTFVFTGGKAFNKPSSQTVTLPETVNNAWIILVNSSHSIYALPYNATNTRDAVLGYLYGDTLKINGVPDEYIDSPNLMPHQAILACGNSGTNKPYIVIDTAAKTLRFTVGSFFLYGGRSVAFPAQTVTYTDSSLATWFAVREDGTIYSTGWNNVAHFHDKIIGALYGTVAWFNGVPSDKIEITGKHSNYGMGLVLPGVSGKFKWNPNTSLECLDGGSVLWNGVKINYSAHVAEVDAVDSQGAYIILFNHKTGKFIVHKWSGSNLTNYPIVGGAWNNYVTLNGVQHSQIKKSSYTEWADFNTSVPDTFVTYNPFTNKLYVPEGYATILGNSVHVNAQTITTPNANDTPLVLAVTSSGAVSARDPETAMSYFTIGSIYKKSINVHGNNNCVAYNKTVAFFGDSITAGAKTTTPYHVWISRLKSIQSLNWGVGSTGFLTPYTGNIIAGNGKEGAGVATNVTGNNTVLDMMKGTTFEHCVIAAGTNDWATNKSLHDFEDMVNETLNYALSVCPYVFVIAPIHRTGETANGNGVPLSDFNKVLQSACLARCIPFFNGFNVPIDPNVKTNLDEFFADSIHPNNAGQKRMGFAFADSIGNAFIK